MNESDTGIEKEVISFYPEKDKKSFKTMEIKYTLSGSNFKLQLPVFNEATAEEFLHFLHEFEEAKGKLGYGTCQKLESGLEQILQGNARQEWKTIKGTILPGTNTVAAFHQRIEGFK